MINSELFYAGTVDNLINSVWQGSIFCRGKSLNSRRSARWSWKQSSTTAWTTTALNAARLQPVEEDLMWLIDFRGCASRSLFLNAFITPDDRVLLVWRLMKASQLICHQLQLLKYFTNAWVLPKWAVCGKHPIFRVPWQGLPHGFCELMFCCRWRSHLRLILKKQRSRFKSFVLFWIPSCPDGGLLTILTVVSSLLPRLAMHSSFFS